MAEEEKAAAPEETGKDDKDKKKKKKSSLPSKKGVKYCNELMAYDNGRLDIVKYDYKMLSDPNRGHWENTDQELLELTNTYYRNPIQDIKEGVIGIDFGTRSTVIVYQDESTTIWPLRIGAKDLQKPVQPTDFETPAIMHFINLEDFVATYNSVSGRPPTSWKDLVISHSAADSFVKSKSEDYYSYLNNLKQWCSQKQGSTRIKDKFASTFEMSSFLSIGQDDFNPIELYAYYLGSYINNMFNGVHMKYLLAYPVLFEKEVLDKIVTSFEKGIKKSLPAAILGNQEIMKKFSVKLGISEVASYAISALDAYSFQPSSDDVVYFSVFDFGAGNTQFNFGKYTRAQDDSRYIYNLDELSTQGDRYLGGEHLLELLAYEVFRNNKKLLRRKKIQFSCPVEGKKFIGSEAFLSNSQEARMNMIQLMEQLRPLLEEGAKLRRKCSVTLYNKDGFKKKRVRLKVNAKELEKIVKTRIESGIRTFFGFLEIAFEELDVSPTQVNIFLAGHSSKSKIVGTLFERIAKEINATLIKKGETNYRKYQEELATKLAEQQAKQATKEIEIEDDNFIPDFSEDVPQEEENPVDDNLSEEDVFGMLGSEEFEIMPEEIEEEEVVEEDEIIIDLPEPKQYSNDLFKIYPPLGTGRTQKGAGPSRSSYSTPTAKTGVAFGVVVGRKGGQINVTDHSRTETGEITFQYYVGDSDQYGIFVEKMSPHVKYGDWIYYSPASGEEVEVYYTTLPNTSPGGMPITETKKATMYFTSGYQTPGRSIYIKAVAPARISYMIGAEGENNNISTISSVGTIDLD
ncbi:MAG: hypothetical protein BEN18_09290 [Epulopiscium sp. Nuni2H_MBin001]|nr:MAG: hypothetical protein BEN18_09290 [Epulopiscium sp. Nuni2H_MBin001]